MNDRQGRGPNPLQPLEMLPVSPQRRRSARKIGKLLAYFANYPIISNIFCISGSAIDTIGGDPGSDRAMPARYQQCGDRRSGGVAFRCGASPGCPVASPLGGKPGRVGAGDELLLVELRSKATRRRRVKSSGRCTTSSMRPRSAATSRSRRGRICGCNARSTGNMAQATCRNRICFLHPLAAPLLLEDAPEAMLTIAATAGMYVWRPGEFRDAFQPRGGGRPAPATLRRRVEAFMAYFEQRYRFEALGSGSRILAIAAAHHRLNYIHPFLDGNGRVSRLMSHAMALSAGSARTAYGRSPEGWQGASRAAAITSG